MQRSKGNVTLTRYLGLILAVMVILIGCQKQPQDWPQQVTESIWIDKEASGAKWVVLNGTYQAYYTSVDCYPGKRFLQTMQDEMMGRGQPSSSSPKTGQAIVRL